MNKSVLVITYYWPPSGGAGVQRFLKFVKYLPGFGINPFVLTVENPTYPIVDESLKEEVPENVDVFKSRTFEPFSLYSKLTGRSVEDSTKPTIELSSGSWKTRLSAWIRANVFIPDARAGWQLTTRKKAASLVNKYGIDTIITTGPPHSVHFTGSYVQKKHGTRWIADFRDPWTGVYYNRLMPRGALAESIDKRMEQMVLKRADEVVVISDSMAELQRSIYNRSYHVIPNGFDPDDFSPVEKQRQDANQKKVIRFIGSVREGALPNSFLEAVHKIGDRSALEIEFIGNSHPALRELIDTLGLGDMVQIKSYVPHNEAIRAMQTADLLLLSISKTPKSELILTGKLFEYLGSGTPILFLGSSTGDAAKIIRDTGQGACFDHGRADDILQFLKRFLEGKTEFNQISDRGQHLYSRKVLTRELANLL